MSRPFVRPETWFFLAAWLAALGGLRSAAFADPGCLWHVVAGDRIRADGLMRTDPFTYTHAGAEWVSQWWAAEVAMSLLHRAAGFDALLLATAALLAALWTGVFARLRAGGMGPPLAAGVAAAAGVGVAYHYLARPHLATILLLGLVMGWLVDFDRRRPGAGWRLVALVPVLAAWANLHGGALGGLGTVGLAAGGWLAGWAAGGRWPTPVGSWRAAAAVAGVAAACGVTPLVGPYGPDLPRAWGRIVGSPVIARTVAEHQPLSLAEPSGWKTAGLGGLYLLALAGTLPRRPRVTWLIPLVWLALTFKSIRHGPLFAVTAAVAAADLWAETAWYRYLRRGGDALAVPPDPAGPGWWGRWLAVPAAAVAAAAGLQLAGVGASLVGRGWARLPDKVPTELVPALRDWHRRAGPDGRLFNDLNLGGFVIYHLPGAKVFADDRFELYGDAWLRAYVDGLYADPGGTFGRWERRYGFTAAVVSTAPGAPPVAAHLARSPRWRRVAAGPRAEMYERLGP